MELVLNSEFRKLFLVVVLLFSLSSEVTSATRKNNLVFENDLVRIKLVPRTPDQVAAFYEARGFPKSAIAEIRSRCFITVSIRSKSKEILWHNLDSWFFRTGEKELTRIHRNQWFKRWRSMSLEQSLQSTFRWTLLPESLDFRPDEGEGGNITLVKTDESITLIGKFKTGKEKNTSEFDFTINNIHCAGDPK